MKALFVARYYEGSPAWYCARAFKKLGIEFEAFDLVEEAGGYDFLYAPSKNPLAYIYQKTTWKTKVSAMNENLVRCAEKSKADFIVFFGTSLIFPETLKHIASVKAKKVLWLIDTFFLGQKLPPMVAECMPLYDLCLVIDAFYMPFYKRLGAKAVYNLDLGCDPEIHKPMTLSDSEKQTYGSNVVYIGNYVAQGSYRLSLLRQLAQFPLTIWGRGWDKAEEPLKKAWTGKPVFGKEFCKVYNASKICVNILPRESMNFINNRVYEAAACGAFVLTEHMERLPDAYVIGKDIESWKTPDELLEKVSYYLTHEKERSAIARTGQEKTRSHHTYENRMKTLCAWVSEQTP